MSDSFETSMDSRLTGFSVHSISRQEYRSGLFPSPGDIPDLGMEHASPALQADSLPLNHQGSFIYAFIYIYIYLFLNLSDHGFITVSITSYNYIKYTMSISAI